MWSSFLVTRFNAFSEEMVASMRTSWKESFLVFLSWEETKSGHCKMRGSRTCNFSPRYFCKKAAFSAENLSVMDVVPQSPRALKRQGTQYIDAKLSQNPIKCGIPRVLKPCQCLPIIVQTFFGKLPIIEQNLQKKWPLAVTSTSGSSLPALWANRHLAMQSVAVWEPKHFGQ